MQKPILINPIPDQVINERAAFSPFNIHQYFQTGSSEDKITYFAELANGDALPKGMICTSDGVLTGIPAKDTQGDYEVLVTATNFAGPTQTTFHLTIKLAPAVADPIAETRRLKSQVWEALQQELPLPEIGDIYNRPISAAEIYYLLERWGVLTMWDAFNLDPPGEKKLLALAGVSEHYQVYDRGCCIIGAPKDLFSYERTIGDSLKTARAMAREVYKRDWSVELVGLDRMTRAAWVEIQRLGDHHGKRLEVINYSPDTDDLRVYNLQVFGPK